jgi:hypothetical protein
MYLVLQDRLVLASPPDGAATAHSQAFTMPMGDDSLELTIVIIVATATSPEPIPSLRVTVEESDDDANWATNFTIDLVPVGVGQIIGPLFSLPAKRYRVRWDFGDLADGAGLCVLAANVETRHV